MLVLSRKPDEAFELGEDVVVRVLSVRGDVVRLGIEAPRNVKVLRSELNPIQRSKFDPNDSIETKPETSLDKEKISDAIG